MTALAYILYGAGCMIVGACGLALFQSTTRDRYHRATAAEKARGLRAAAEHVQRDVRRGK